MGLFEFLFGSSVVTCDECGGQIDGEPIVVQHRDYCAHCNQARLEAIEHQRASEDAARERIMKRQRFQG